MKVKGLDGREHNWALRSRRRRSASLPHRRAREMIARLFPCEPALEELTLPGTGGLRADFYLPRRRVMVEVHGPQHYGPNSHFHRTEWEFRLSQGRDRRKRSWCELNDIRLVELPHDEPDEHWRRLLLDGGRTPP